MDEKTRIAVMRGAGLSFALASFLFVFTWNWLVFLLIPIGALVGFALSRLPEREPKAGTATAGGGAARMWQSLHEYLVHPNLLRRFANLLLLATGLFVLAWLTGYYLLPEGAFRAAGEEQLARAGLGATAGTVFAEWLRIFAYNLVIAGSLTVLANLVLRVNGIPLGYIVPFYNVVGYALFIGTNSFLIPYPERLAPTFAILRRSGPYEMMALLIFATATATWSRYQVRRLFRTNPEPVEPRPRIRSAHLLFIALGVIILALANWLEAARIVALQ